MYKYVIIDDEPLIREGVRKQLQPLDHTLLFSGEADNGESGIQLIDECSPDIAIVDMQMPIMDGAKLLPYLAEHYEHIQLIIISGYKDFDYIKIAISSNAVDYILKPFSRQQIQETALKAVAKLVNSQTLSNQILSSKEEKEQAYYTNDIQLLQQMILEYHPESMQLHSQRLNYINSTHSMILMTLYSSTPISDIDTQTYLEYIGFGSLSLFLPHPNNLYLGFVILFMPEHSMLQSNNLCTQIAEHIIQYFSTNQSTVRIGISQVHNSLNDLHMSYNESCSSLNNQSPNDTKKQYSFYSDFGVSHTFNWDKTEEFLFRLEAGLTKEVQKLLEELYLYYLSLPDLTLNDVKLHYFNLTNRCLTVMSYYSKQYKPSQSMQNIIKSIFDLKELQRYYTRFFSNLSDILGENSVYTIDDTIEKIKIYTQRNYQKKISIELMGSLFYLNPSYLSYLFHHETGTKFIDYLNQIRINRSKELLSSSDYKMYEIAKLSGYDNTKYFFRVFKKNEGITPKQFQTNQTKGPSPK